VVIWVDSSGGAGAPSVVGGTDITGPYRRAGADDRPTGEDRADTNGHPSNGRATLNGLSQAPVERQTALPGSPESPAPQPQARHAILPDIEVATGESPIPTDERAAIEAQAPDIAEDVEEIAEDRDWLSHKLLNVRTIVSFALAIGILVFIFTRLDIDPAATWDTMRTANPLLLLAAFVVYYSAFWVRGGRWKKLLRNAGLDSKVTLPSVNGLVEIIYLSWFVNCIVPAKLGDAYRSYLLKRNSGVSFSSTIGTILAERVIDLLVLFGLLGASFTLVGQRLASSRGIDLPLVMVAGGLMVLALVVGLVGLRFFGHLLVRLVPHRFREKFVSFRDGILRSFKRSSIPMLLGYTVLIWLMEGGRLFFVTRSLDAHEVTLSAVIFIALLSSLLTTLPLTPGGAGVVEGAVVLSMSLFVDDHNLAVSIALLDRLINYWSIIVGGIVLYFITRRR
jgi:uncharacterized protein (TIRG00374 family)